MVSTTESTKSSSYKMILLLLLLYISNVFVLKTKIRKSKSYVNLLLKQVVDV